MKQLKTLALGAVFLLVLTSCGGFIRNQIGAQDATDALHLNNLKVTASSEPAPAALALQADRTLFTATGEARFPDIDWDEIQSKAPINVPIPRSYREALGINKAGIVLASPAAPSELVIEGITLDLKFSNANGSPVVDFSLGMENLPEPLQPRLALKETDLDGNSLYEVDPDFADALLNLIEVNLAGPKFAAFFNILTDNGKPQTDPDDYNRLQVGVNVWLSSPDGILAGSEFSFQFATRDGVLDWTK